MYKILLSAFLSFSFCCQATEYWVSPSGTDADPGTNAKPFSITKGISTAAAGDVIWIKGGLYKTKATLKFANAGSAGNYIRFWAVPGEVPVIDCADFANGTSTSRGMDIKKDFCHVKGLTIQYAGYNGIAVGASNTIIEGCTIHHCEIDGVTLTNLAKNTLVLNCDSYLNWDKSDGNNGDGFSAKRGSLEGNVFRGCRAWLNSDDGWDTYGGISPVLIDSCWAFSNGYNVFGYSGTWSGNGNGFKVGAAGPDNAENVITNSVAFNNRSKGFDHNHSTCGQTVINCTGYDNKAPNFSFYDNPTQGVLMKNIMRNNISCKGTTSLAVNTEQVTNSWNLNLTFTDNDFVSVDTSLALVKRNFKYRIPETGLFRLKSSNPARNVGTAQNYVALKGSIPYEGSAPDLGAFEFKEGVVNGLNSGSAENENALMASPNPFDSKTEVRITPKFSGYSSVTIYDMDGIEVEKLFEGDMKESVPNIFAWDSQVKKGMYVCVIKNSSSVQTIKLIKN